MDSRIVFAVKTAASFEVLHNFCIMNGDEWNNWDRNDGNDDEDDDVNTTQDGDNIREIKQWQYNA